jgi:hypothetical protein
MQLNSLLSYSCPHERNRLIRELQITMPMPSLDSTLIQLFHFASVSNIYAKGEYPAQPVNLKSKKAKSEGDQPSITFKALSAS